MKPSSFALVVLVSLLAFAGAAPVAHACIWAGVAGGPSSAGKMIDVPRTDAEQKHVGAHRIAAAQHVGAVARLYASAPGWSFGAYAPSSKND